MNTGLRFLFLFVSILFSIHGKSQIWEAVINNPAYIYGEGWGVTVAEADRQALNDLISKISINVEGSTTNIEQEKALNGDVESNTDFKSVVKTYSQATLNNTERVILENEPDAHVGRWIKKSEIAKIFESRKNKIRDFVESAVKAEKINKIDVALKDFYWALCLLQSLQYPNEMEYITEDGQKVLLINWIPSQMNEIFSNLTTEVSGQKGDNLEIYITYKNKPVTSIDYSYFDGRDWGSIYSAKDGIGTLELSPGNLNDTFQIKYEYEFAGEAHIDKEVAAVISATKTLPMRNAYQTFKRDSGEKLSINNKQTESSSKKQVDEAPTNNQLENIIQNTVARILDATEKKRYEDVKSSFTPAGYNVYEQLLKYGKAKTVGTPDIKIYDAGDYITAKGVQMSFSFATGIRKSFVEDIVFTFNNQGLIENISFGLGKQAENDILKMSSWDDKAKHALINFMENYQTAYALKRLDYIETIFDDDAVIITGTVLRKGGQKISGDVSGLQFGGDIIKYNRYTKDEYIKELKRSFAGKEYINLRFADNEIRKLGVGGEMYAIQISQEYYSSNYGDKGYLFLMIDMNDPINPVIKIRTWQPEKDPEFGIYGPEHFQ